MTEDSELAVLGGDVGDDRARLGGGHVGRRAAGGPVVGIDDELGDRGDPRARIVERGPDEAERGRQVAHLALHDRGERGEIGLPRMVGAHEVEDQLEAPCIAEAVAAAAPERRSIQSRIRSAAVLLRG